jgi:hypothetical protein
MGRPLNKKYFDAVPTSIGEGVSSVTITGQGNYNALATVTFSAPGLPGGTTASGSVRMELRSVSINNAGGSYTAGDVLVIGGGSVVGDTTAGTYTAQAQIQVDTVGGSGEILTFTALSVRGSYSALPQKVTGGSNVTNLSLAGGTGTNARVNVTWRVLSVTISSAGSGYVSVADAAPTFSAGTSTATGTSVLTSTGTNVILAHAYVVDGTQTLDADIIKQTSTNEYLMETTEGQSIVTLVASNSLSAGQAYIKATDSLSSTYYVTKLTAHLALLERWTDSGSGWVYASGEDAPWSLESTSVDSSGMTVQIESA